MHTVHAGTPRRLLKHWPFAFTGLPPAAAKRGGLQRNRAVARAALNKHIRTHPFLEGR